MCGAVLALAVAVTVSACGPSFDWQHYEPLPNRSAQQGQCPPGTQPRATNLGMVCAGKL